MKRLNSIINSVMAAFLGVFIGHSAYVFRNYKTHPELYAMQSAPWYTSLWVDGLIVLAAVLVCTLLKIFGNHMEKTKKP